MSKHKGGVPEQLQRFQQSAQQGRIIQIGSEPLKCKCGNDVLIAHQIVRVQISRLSKQMQLDSAGCVFTCARCGATVSPDVEQPTPDAPSASPVKPEAPTAPPTLQTEA